MPPARPCLLARTRAAQSAQDPRISHRQGLRPASRPSRHPQRRRLWTEPTPTAAATGNERPASDIAWDNNHEASSRGKGKGRCATRVPATAARPRQSPIPPITLPPKHLLCPSPAIGTTQREATDGHSSDEGGRRSTAGAAKEGSRNSPSAPRAADHSREGRPTVPWSPHAPPPPTATPPAPPPLCTAAPAARGPAAPSPRCQKGRQSQIRSDLTGAHPRAPREGPAVAEGAARHHAACHAGSTEAHPAASARRRRDARRPQPVLARRKRPAHALPRETT
nr:nascent polypeptide-associated complex subunit alpha, muscle-specific form-like [Aegilops tauschii subsp. strangulata]